jgi:hypothetical protein
MMVTYRKNPVVSKQNSRKLDQRLRQVVESLRPMRKCKLIDFLARSIPLFILFFLALLINESKFNPVSAIRLRTVKGQVRGMDV